LGNILQKGRFNIEMGRSEFTNQQRKEIILHHEEDAEMTNRALTAWANQRFNTSVSEMTISRLLKKKEVYLQASGRAAGPAAKRVRKPNCPEVEEATYAWLRMAVLQKKDSSSLPDDVICETARRFYADIPREPGAKELRFSHGWVEGFKRRFDIRGLFGRHGEASCSGRISQETLARMDEIRQLVSKYNPGDVFNMDETGLFYRLEPNRSLATQRLAGKKQQEERITVALTVNADGTCKLPPLVVSTSLLPHAFSSRHIVCPENLGILWFANEHARMTMRCFEKFLLDFERRMADLGKEKVLLLVDNFSGHQVDSAVATSLTITAVEFLPANTTSKFQPMDAGILQSFKAYYRKALIEHKLECLMTNRDSEIDVYQAVKMIERVWRMDVTPQTISNCWRHLFDLDFSKPQDTATLNGDQERDLEEVAQVLEQFALVSRDTIGVVPTMDALEYVQYELGFDLKNPYMEATEDNIDFEMEGSQAHTFDGNGEGEQQLASGSTRCVDFLSVMDAVRTIHQYLEQRPTDVTSLIRMLASLEEGLLETQATESHQLNIHSYFHPFASVAS
jgi:hypothetical protein